jgi:hypothetical protein
LPAKPASVISATATISALETTASVKITNARLVPRSRHASSTAATAPT